MRVDRVITRPIFFPDVLLSMYKRHDKPSSTPKANAYASTTQDTWRTVANHKQVEDIHHHLFVITLHATAATICILILVECELQLSARNGGHWGSGTSCGCSRIAITRRIVKVTKLWMITQFFLEFWFKGILEIISLNTAVMNKFNSPQSRRRRRKSDCHLRYMS